MKVKEALFKMKNPNKSKNLSSGQRSYHQVYLEMWLYNKRPCRAAAGARALFAPVNLCESIRKFVQRLPINCPPDLPPRFVQDERKLTSAHQTHLGAWRDRRIFISVQDEGKVFPAAGVDVHVKQFTPLVDLHDVIEREYPNVVVLNCDSRKAARGPGNERHTSNLVTDMTQSDFSVSSGFISVEYLRFIKRSVQNTCSRACFYISMFLCCTGS